jgi:WD40 repeat protein
MGEPTVAPGECQTVPPVGITPYTFISDPTGVYGAAPQAVDVVRVWGPARKLLAEIPHTDPVDWEAVQQRLINRGISSYRAYLPIIDRMKKEGSVRVFALSPSGKYLITTREADEKLRIWDTASKHLVFSEIIAGQNNSLFDFLSETRLLRVDRKSKEKGSLAIIDLPKVSAQWSAPVEWPAAVTISEDQQVIAWADGRDKQFTIQARETSTGQPLFERKVETEVKKLYFDRAHRFLVASVGEQPVVPSGLPFGSGFVLWQISDGKEITTVPETDYVIAFEFSADGSSFAAINRDGRLRVWDLDSGAVTRTVLRNPGPLAFSASTKWIAAGSGSVQILDRTSLRPVAQLDFPADARRIEFQSEDRVLAVTGFQTGDTRGVTYLRYWQPADLLAEACKRLPFAAAEAQWRQLFVDRPLPATCVGKQNRRSLFAEAGR